MGIQTSNREKIYALLANVTDPEIPVLSVLDLGIVREVNENNDNEIEVVITPTYSGCPAMDVIATSIRMNLMAAGFNKLRIRNELSPAWTTDWMTEAGREKLRAYGIAPPNPKQQVCNEKAFAAAEAVQCPQCQSWNTIRVSEFGSTACKSLYTCADCKEPFDYFKCH